MSRYTSATDADRRAMLDAIGVGSVEEMFRDIPEPVRQREPIALPDGMAEQDVYEHLRSLVSRGVHPHSRETLRTYSVGFGCSVVEVPLEESGATDVRALAEAVDDDVSAVVLQQPNFLGTVEDLGPLAEAAKRTGALLVCSVDPLTMGILRPPGDFGVDVAMGEGQSLGNRLDFGGPSFGFFAAQEKYMRRMPGRIAGETVDIDGKRGFVLTLQTREQHIRREKATHNITTAQALNALAGVIYLSWLGKRGLGGLGGVLFRRPAYAREAPGAGLVKPGA